MLTGRRLTESIDERFDSIVGSHVLEHTVCLITFLNDAETLPGRAASCRSLYPIAGIAMTGSATGRVSGE